ncbi:MAG TPA: DUF2550 family protein [Streptosporangiaceae bacterium]|nr:DUF2550 family protein [Streptosporangiaceae bacterium]
MGGGALALDAAWLFAAFLIIAILAAAGIAARRFLLERGGGTVECGLRKGDGPWRLGLASYQREELYWFGVFGVSMRPDETFPRRDLSLVARRLPSDAEAASLGPGMIVVECQLGDGTSAADHDGASAADGDGTSAAGGDGASAGRADGDGASAARADGDGGGASRADGDSSSAASDRDGGGAGGADGTAVGGGAVGGSGGGGAANGRRGGGGRGGAGGRVELALAESALTGLLSWLEAAPPGSHLDMAL